MYNSHILLSTLPLPFTFSFATDLFKVILFTDPQCIFDMRFIIFMKTDFTL